MPVLDVLWAMLIFFLFIAWIWLLITIFIDIFRSDISGWGKAGWVILVLFLPFLGVLIYLIVNGSDMQERRVADYTNAQAAQEQYIQSVASNASPADQLEKLSKLHDQGALTDEEYAAQKQKVLNS
jgi:hypothetical protein